MSTLPDFITHEDCRSLVGDIRTRSLVARPASVADCRKVLEYCAGAGLQVCPRGAGRSYGDAALLDSQVLLDVTGMDRILDFDQDKAQIRVEAGVRLIDIFRHVHARGLTLPASPTESHSTVSGALSANVNGKDGWRQGSFYHHVLRLSLMTAAGEALEVRRGEPLFDAVVGGMGLLGIVLEATLQLRPVPSPYLAVRRIAAPDVDALLATLEEVQESSDLLVAWVDAYAGGRRAGRAVVHAASWTDHDSSVEARQALVEEAYDGLERHRRMGLAVHEMFGPLLSLMLYAQRPLLYLFNRLYYRMSAILAGLARRPKRELFMQFSFAASFTVPPAHLVCGPRGYTVQLSFPRTRAREAMIELLAICRSSPCPPVTTVLRAHRRDDGLLSFSEDGYSLNFEFHPKPHTEAASRAAVDRLIDATASYAGRIHLTKDQVLRPEQFRRIYPRWEDFLRVKAQLDPANRLSSDLARRVGLVS
jgi:decaprenylphospho-beta-D-ribofuranose 2-oxidase